MRLIYNNEAMTMKRTRRKLISILLKLAAFLDALTLVVGESRGVVELGVVVVVVVEELVGSVVSAGGLKVGVGALARPP